MYVIFRKISRAGGILDQKVQKEEGRQGATPETPPGSAAPGTQDVPSRNPVCTVPVHRLEALLSKDQAPNTQAPTRVHEGEEPSPHPSQTVEKTMAVMRAQAKPQGSPTRPHESPRQKDERDESPSMAIGECIFKDFQPQVVEQDDEEALHERSTMMEAGVRKTQGDPQEQQGGRRDGKR